MPGAAHSVARLISTRLTLAQSMPARSKRLTLVLSDRQFLEIEHGQPVDHAVRVEQRDLERRLRQLAAEAVGDHEGAAGSPSRRAAAR